MATDQQEAHMIQSLLKFYNWSTPGQQDTLTLSSAMMPHHATTELFRLYPMSWQDPTAFTVMRPISMEKCSKMHVTE